MIYFLLSKDFRVFCKFSFTLTLLSLSLSTVRGLECYACERQSGNKDKCIKTTKQCEQVHDVCKAVVSWQLPDHWTPYGNRMHHVSKECGVRTQCEAERKENINHCRRDWFADWSCIECCSGDLCNYYVTLTASRLTGRIVLLLCSTMLASIYFAF